MRNSARLKLNKRKSATSERRALVLRKRPKPKRPGVIDLRDREFDGGIGDMTQVDRQQPYRGDDDHDCGIDMDEWEVDGVFDSAFDRSQWEPDGIFNVAPVKPSSDITDGRYWGGNLRLTLELRVDFSGSAIISGDLFTNFVSGRHFLASFRTQPGLSVFATDPQPWEIILEDANGHTGTGLLTLDDAVAEQSVAVGLRINTAMPGLPTHRIIEMTAEWRSSSLRVLSVELEREDQVALPPTYVQDSKTVDIDAVMRDAGIELNRIGAQSVIPKLPDGYGWGIEQLHGLMMSLTQNQLEKPDWRQQLLWLGTPSRASLLGVMFDNRGELQRQGTAVFRNEIERYFPHNTDRKIIQTTAHEIGHALNLAHRFEREVGRADSTSIMNYDWRYRGGNRRDEYWKKFDFTFDSDERAFLGHGARGQIVPGGAPFHSATYWSNGNGGYSPYYPEVESDAFSLQLDPPPGKHGAVFEFGQPVLLKVSITNNTPHPLRLNKTLLDPKSGFLQVLIKRVDASTSSMADARQFVPLYERCMDVDEDEHIVTLAPGQSFADNLNITFGASGFSFAEPGLYDIQVVSAVPMGFVDGDADNDYELILTSNTLRLYVSSPKSLPDEIDLANVLFRDDVGTFFVLGGSKHLLAAQSDLTELCNRRLHKRKTVSDPIAANILRCNGIDAGRWSLSGKSSQGKIKDGDPAQAVKFLERLREGQDVGLRFFDEETARTTLELIDKHLHNASGNPKRRTSRKTSDR